MVFFKAHRNSDSRGVKLERRNMGEQRGEDEEYFGFVVDVVVVVNLYFCISHATQHEFDLIFHTHKRSQLQH